VSFKNKRKIQPVKFCPYCGSEEVEKSSGTYRCTNNPDCRAVFFLTFSRKARRRRVRTPATERPA